MRSASGRASRSVPAVEARPNLGSREELFAFGGVLRLGPPLGVGCRFGLHGGRTRRCECGLRLCLYRLFHRAFAHIANRVVAVGTEQVSEERPNAARARRGRGHAHLCGFCFA